MPRVWVSEQGRVNALAWEDELSDEEGQLRPDVARRLAPDRAFHEHQDDGATRGAFDATTLLQGVVWFLGALAGPPAPAPDAHPPVRARHPRPVWRPVVVPPVRHAQDRPGPHPFAMAMALMLLCLGILAGCLYHFGVTRQRHVVQSVPIDPVPVLGSPVVSAPPPPAVSPRPQPVRVEGAPASSRLVHQPKPVQAPVPKIAEPRYTKIGFHGFLPPKPPYELASPPQRYTMDQILGRRRHTAPASETEVIAPPAYAQGYSSVSQRPVHANRHGAVVVGPQSGYGVPIRSAPVVIGPSEWSGAPYPGFVVPPTYVQSTSPSKFLGPDAFDYGPPRCGGR